MSDYYPQWNIYKVWIYGQKIKIKSKWILGSLWLSLPQVAKQNHI